jgi:hypothetical protein
VSDGRLDCAARDHQAGERRDGLRDAERALHGRECSGTERTTRPPQGDASRSFPDRGPMRADARGVSDPGEKKTATVRCADSAQRASEGGPGAAEGVRRMLLLPRVALGLALALQPAALGDASKRPARPCASSRVLTSHGVSFHSPSHTVRLQRCSIKTRWPDQRTS